ncbi:MAG TPA: HAD-IA family hydrolase [Verrucomicrobiae bacterium]|nr:HAD-IA family hydrolase [Verrucomicrobiae bacterium]
MAKSSSKIQAITFDVGGTLISPWPSVGHVYAEVALRNGFVPPSPQLLNERFGKAWRACAMFDYTRRGWEELVQETFQFPGGSVPFFADLYERFTEPDVWKVFDDVKPALDAVASQRVKLAVISNWDERLRLLLDRVGLAQYFESQFISCEVGAPKPSRVIFDRAASVLKVDPAAILHVGDSLEMDVHGARNARFQAVLLDRGQDVETEMTVPNLLSLVRRIECA